MLTSRSVPEASDARHLPTNRERDNDVLKDEAAGSNRAVRIQEAYPARLIHYASSRGVSKKAQHCSFHADIAG